MYLINKVFLFLNIGCKVPNLMKTEYEYNFFTEEELSHFPQKYNGKDNLSLCEANEIFELIVKSKKHNKKEFHNDDDSLFDSTCKDANLENNNEFYNDNDNEYDSILNLRCKNANLDNNNEIILKSTLKNERIEHKNVDLYEKLENYKKENDYYGILKEIDTNIDQVIKK